MNVQGILTFVDEVGQEWLAGCEIGPLLRFEEGIPEAMERMEPGCMKDRVFTLKSITAVDPE